MWPMTESWPVEWSTDHFHKNGLFLDRGGPTTQLGQDCPDFSTASWEIFQSLANTNG